VFGRDPGCDLVTDDDRVSRRHAEIQGSDGGWSVRDLGSKNGIAVDGRRVVATTLAGARWLSLGGLPVRFEQLSEADLRESLSAEERRRRLTIELTGPSTTPDPRARGSGAALDGLLESARALADADRAYLLLLDRDRRPRLEAFAGAERGSGGFSGSTSTVERVLATAEPIVAADVASFADLAGRDSVRAGGIAALVCLPLLRDGAVIGALYADSGRPGRFFSELDVDLLAAIGDHLVVALAGARLAGEIDRISGALG
jgi:transcriptional regulator with GAF, ATPase, and Fis domain